jgi:hypothetical protein
MDVGWIMKNVEGLQVRGSRLERRRQELRSRPSYQFIDAEAFVRLAVSPRALTRADDPTARVRGLLDVRTGERFLTEEEKLFDIGMGVVMSPAAVSDERDGAAATGSHA